MNYVRNRRTPAIEGRLGLNIDSLVERYHDIVYRSAFILTADHADAEDLTQQTFLQACSRCHQLRDPAAAKGWLLAIARNLFFKSRKRREAISASTLSIEIEDFQEVPVYRTEFPVDGDSLITWLDLLDESHRIVLQLYYLEEKSYRQIAEILEVQVGTVMSRLFRAKEKLRQLVEQKIACQERTQS